MKTIVLTLRGSSRIDRVQNHLKEVGVQEFKLFYGLNGAKSGLQAGFPYEVDNPGSGYKIDSKHVGCSLSHWILWTSLEFHSRDSSDDDYWMIVEDDVIFRDGWKEKLQSAIKDLPDNWDILYAGHCCIHTRIDGYVREGLLIAKPLCTHCYLVRKKALPVLIEENQKIYAPIDIQMYFGACQKLNTYAIYPRIADQDGTIIND